MFLFIWFTIGSVMAQEFYHCSDAMAQYHSPKAVRWQCEGFSHGHSYTYPDDFKYRNEHKWYTCPTSGLRIVISNGLPNHDVKVMNPNDPCVTNWQVQFALNATYTAQRHEPGAADIIGMQLNGVPMYGPQEAEGENAVLGKGVTDAKYWYGHTSPSKNWHYHSPLAGNSNLPSEDQHIGYAMDGFPLYGALKDPSVLDQCNGRMVNGQYQYHIKTVDQVNGTGSMCNGTDPGILWDYIFGCFHGDLSKTKVSNSKKSSIPSDCVEDKEMTAIGHLHKYNTHQYNHRHF